MELLSWIFRFFQKTPGTSRAGPLRGQTSGDAAGCTFICRTCGEKFATESELLNHKTQQIPGDGISGSLPVSSIPDQCTGPSHTHITNPQIPRYDQIINAEAMTGFLCKSCGRTFSTEIGLQSHIHAPDEILVEPDKSTIPQINYLKNSSIDTRFVNEKDVGVKNMGSERIRYDKFPGKIGYLRKK